MIIIFHFFFAPLMRYEKFPSLNRMISDVCYFLLQCMLLSCGGKVTDEHISLLINTGLLVSTVRILNGLLKFQISMVMLLGYGCIRHMCILCVCSDCNITFFFVITGDWASLCTLQLITCDLEVN